jgi:hypothetical protein
MYLLVFHVPKTHVETVKDAVFAAGAGQIGNYARCSWQVLGTGQFLPLDGAEPAIGTVGTVETVGEYRVEMVVGEHRITEVVAALLASHPYEVPSYHLIPVLTLEQTDSN